MSTPTTNQNTTAPVSHFIPLSNFLPSYVMIIVLSFVVILILCGLLFNLAYPKIWTNMIQAPLLGRR